MDLDGPGEVGGVICIKPVLVGEPCVGLGYGDQLTRPVMIQPGRLLALLVQDFIYALDLRDEGLYVGVCVPDVDVSDLMVVMLDRDRHPRLCP